MGAVTVIKFECDGCRQRIEATGEMLGTSIACPKCGMSLCVPRVGNGDSLSGVVPVPLLLSTQGVAAAGLTCLVAGLALVARRTALPLAGLLLLGTLVAGGLAWRRRLTTVGSALVLAAVLAPWLFFSSAAPPAASSVALPAVPWTEGTAAYPVAAPPPIALPRPMPIPRAEPAAAPGLASEPKAADEPAGLPDAGLAFIGATEPELEQEPEPVLSPVFSDDPFRDVFGPDPDEAVPADEGVGPGTAGLTPDSPPEAAAPMPVAAMMLDSDRIVLALIETPDNAALLEALRGEIGAIANEDKKMRLMAAYALGCLHIGKRQEAAKVQGYFIKRYPMHPLTRLLEADAIFKACAACDGTGGVLQPCPDCQGDGGCQRCTGSGQRELPGMDGAVRSVACVTCRGTGQCRKCQGSGQVSAACETCQGTGKVLAKAAIRKAYMALLEGRTP